MENANKFAENGAHKALEALAYPYSTTVGSRFSLHNFDITNKLRSFLNVEDYSQVLAINGTPFEFSIGVCNFLDSTGRNAAEFEELVPFLTVPVFDPAEPAELPLEYAERQFVTTVLLEDITGAVINTAYAAGTPWGSIEISIALENQPSYEIGRFQTLLLEAPQGLELFVFNVWFSNIADPLEAIAGAAQMLTAVLKMAVNPETTAQPILINHLNLKAFSEHTLDSPTFAEERRERNFLEDLFNYQQNHRVGDELYRSLVKIEPRLTRSDVAFFPLDWTEYPTLFSVSEGLDTLDSVRTLTSGFNLLVEDQMAEISHAVYDEEEGEDEDEAEDEEDSDLDDPEEDEDDTDALREEAQDDILASIEEIDLDFASGMVRFGTQVGVSDWFFRATLKHLGFGVHLSRVPEFSSVESAALWAVGTLTAEPSMRPVVIGEKVGSLSSVVVLVAYLSWKRATQPELHIEEREFIRAVVGAIAQCEIR